MDNDTENASVSKDYLYRERTKKGSKEVKS